MKGDDSCSIEARVPEKANQKQIEAAIKQALETQWTDLSSCTDKITINVKFPPY
jgi:hypothetical protein